MPKITLPQNSLNLLRNFLAQPGWARTTKDIYLGGKLLAETLPELDISWVRNDKELAAMASEEREAYRAIDREFCDKPCEIEISDGERDVVRKCMEKLTEGGVVPPGKYTFRLFDIFGFKPE